MKHLIKFLTIISLFSSIIQCKKNTENDEYEIINLVLKKDIKPEVPQSLMSKLYEYESPEYKKEYAKKLDSLIKNKYYTYYVVPNFIKMDTIKGTTQTEILLYQETKEKLKLDKIINLSFAKRLDKDPCEVSATLINCPENYIGTYRISKIIFNKKRNKAFVNIVDMTCAKCAKEIQFILKKESGTWKISREKLMWIS